jgi:hypothetical protein
VESTRRSRSPRQCAHLANGWFVIVMNRTVDAFDRTIDPARLSRGAEVVTCTLEEHVMVSGFARWKDGERLVTVDHDAQQSIRHLDVAGSVSPEMSEIIAEAISSQDREDQGEAEVDFICDIPIDIAYRLTGYRHDRAEVDGIVQRYEVLEKLPRPQPRSSWRSLFGKGAG